MQLPSQILRSAVEHEIAYTEKQIQDNLEAYRERRDAYRKNIAYAHKHMVSNLKGLRQRKAELKTALKTL